LRGLDADSGFLLEWFQVQGFFTFEFYARAFEECFDHFSDAFLHLGTDGALADKNRKAMQVFGVLAAKLDVLDDLDQDFVPALFESRRVPEIVFISDAPATTRDVPENLPFSQREGRMNRADNRHFSPNLQRMMPPASFRMPSMPGIRSAKLRSSPKNSRAFSMWSVVPIDPRKRP
jgi:hypothetical protein